VHGKIEFYRALGRLENYVLVVKNETDAVYKFGENVKQKSADIFIISAKIMQRRGM
jgi:hypothetical protein